MALTARERAVDRWFAASADAFQSTVYHTLTTDDPDSDPP